MKKSTLINIFLTLFSLSVTLFAAEYILRSLLKNKSAAFDFLRDPSYYALYYNEVHENFFNEEYWKLNYLFGRGFEMDNPHPLLGWVGFFDRDTYEHWHDDGKKKTRPVLLFGDSFAMCVEWVDCFEDILNADTSFSKTHQLLNYGVGGYGIDQISLLFNQTSGLHEKPFIIFSMLTTDLDRSVLKIRDGQKPYYDLNDGELELKGTPITQPSHEYFEQNPPEIKSYVWNLVSNVFLHKYLMPDSGRTAYIENIKDLNAKILEKTFAELKSLNTEFVVLIFQPAWHSTNEWRLDFLKNICVENNVPFIVDVDVRQYAINELGHQNQELFIPNDGHPTSLANRIMAEEMKKCVLDTSYYMSLLGGRDIYMANREVELRKQYRDSILANEKLLEIVTKKADEFGIPVDSVISLEVQNMILNPVEEKNE